MHAFADYAGGVSHHNNLPFGATQRGTSALLWRGWRWAKLATRTYPPVRLVRFARAPGVANTRASFGATTAGARLLAGLLATYAAPPCLPFAGHLFAFNIAFGRRDRFWRRISFCFAFHPLYLAEHCCFIHGCIHAPLARDALPHLHYPRRILPSRALQFYSRQGGKSLHWQLMDAYRYCQQSRGALTSWTRLMALGKRAPPSPSLLVKQQGMRSGRLKRHGLAHGDRQHGARLCKTFLCLLPWLDGRVSSTTCLAWTNGDMAAVATTLGR